MAIKKVLAVGCSFTQGYGLNNTIDDAKLWVNQLYQMTFPAAEIINLSREGANNHWIFLETISALIDDSYDCVIVGWTAIPRYNFNVGLELYNVTTTLDNNRDVNTNSQNYTKHWLGETGDRLRRMHNDHWDILDLIKYINTLVELQTSRGQKIFFVNSLCPWPAEYFNKKEITVPSDLTDFEKSLLSVQSRSDDQIVKLYDMIHEQYLKYNGVQEHHWLNLYSSLRELKIDVVCDDDFHPGYLSQDKFVDQLLPQLKSKI